MRKIITVDNISKRYHLGASQAASETLRESLTEFFKNPMQRVRRNGHRASEELWALRNVSFDVEPGEVIGIIGRNGAGKSTLLKILTRITEPTSGRVKLYGRVGSLLEVGTGFHPELTGRENIYLNGAILGMKRAEITRKFDEIVAFADIERFLDTPVKHYSSGMYMRLAFAVAAHMEPEILLVDEVLAVGDYEFQKKCIGKMRDVSEGGRTVVFVSHNVGVVSNLCSRVIWLDRGCVRAEGQTNEIVPAYVALEASARGEVAWGPGSDPPGGGGVRLRAVRLRGARGAVTSDVFINEPITIEIEYQNMKEGNLLIWGIEVKDKMGGYVFATNNRPSVNLGIDEWFGRPRPVGVYKTSCVIPAHLLNDDFYSIDLRMVSARNELWLLMESVLSFVVHESGEMIAEYIGHWVGVVRPKLAWTTEYEG